MSVVHERAPTIQRQAPTKLMQAGSTAGAGIAAAWTVDWAAPDGSGRDGASRRGCSYLCNAIFLLQCIKTGYINSQEGSPRRDSLSAHSQLTLSALGGDPENPRACLRRANDPDSNDALPSQG